MGKGPENFAHKGLKPSQNGSLACRRLTVRAAWLIASILLAIWILSTPNPAFARGTGLRIDNMSPAQVEAEPRQIVTSTFRVLNDTDSEYEIETTVELPPEWTLASPLFPFKLQPHEEKFLFVAFSIPQNAFAGGYTANIKVATTGFFSIADETQVEVELLPVAKVEVHPPTGEYRTFSGDIYTRTFIVLNLSNASSRFETDVKSDQPWDVKAEPSTFNLGPGESQKVVISAFTPKDISREVKHQVTLIAHALDLNHGSVSAKASITTSVFPRKLQGDLYQTLRGSYSLLFSWEEDENLAAQFKLDLEGDLGEGRWGIIQFVSPYQSEWRGHQFLQEESYLVKYGVDDKGYLSLGDDSITITPLTERYFYGRGVDFKISRDDFSFRGFASKRRNGWLPEILAGGQISIKAPGNTEFTLTGFMKQEVEVPSNLNREKRKGVTWSFSGTSNPAEGVNLEAEYGLGEYDNGEGEGKKQSEAYRLAAKIISERFKFDGELVRGGTDFAGYWGGTDSGRAYLSFNLSDNLSLWSNYSSSSWDYGGDPLRPHPEYSNYDIGLNWSTCDVGRVSLYRRWKSNKDTNLLQWDDHDKTTNIQISHQFEDFSLTGIIAFGNRNNLLTETSRNIRQYELMFNARPNSDSQISGGYRWDVEDTEFKGKQQRIDQFWLSGDIKINSKTELNAQYSHSEGSNQPDIRWLRANLKHILKGDRSIQLMTQWQGGDFGDNLDIALMLTFPLEVPVPWLPKGGRLEGRVYVGEQDGQPLKDIVVGVDGMKVATDENGLFVFPTLEEGEYELTIERGSLGLGRVANLRAPFNFTIVAGETVKLDIPIVKAATVAGAVIIQQGANGKNSGNGRNNTNSTNGVNGNSNGSNGNADETNHSTKGFSGIAMSLTNDEESYTRYTDRNGKFTFTELRPGHWKLAVAAEQIPEYHEIKPLDFEFDLEPGQAMDNFEFLISPIARTIVITAGKEK